MASRPAVPTEDQARPGQETRRRCGSDRPLRDASQERQDDCRGGRTCGLQGGREGAHGDRAESAVPGAARQRRHIEEVGRSGGRDEEGEREPAAMGMVHQEQCAQLSAIRRQV